MTRVALYVLALALIIAPAAAQTYGNEPQQQPLQQEQPAEPQAEPLQSPPVQEERTDPESTSIAGDSGLTVTGTVVSVSDSALVLQTTAGQHTVQLDNRTTKPATINVGDRVTIDYTRTSSGVMIASAIRSEGLESTTSTGVTTGTTTGTTTLQTEAEAEAEADMEASASADVDTDSELPETGSELPLIGLLGLMALLAAAGFRVARNNA